MIPYGHQSVNQADIDCVTAVLRGEWLTTGPAVAQFESALQRWAGDTPCAVVTSGTAALHTAYAAAGIGPGDEVITPPITFAATQSAAVQLGATVVFADVLDDTANIDPEAVAAAITSKTKAIVAVDYAGHPADLDELRALADQHDLLLIEDAAHSIGSTYRGHPVGSLADLTTFSFFATKNITTGEGSAVCSGNPELLERARRFRNHGLIRDRELMALPDEGAWHQEIHEIGLNYRLPDVLAALGTSQLLRLAQFKQRRQAIFDHYTAGLQDLPGVRLPSVSADVDPVWHLYPLRVLDGRRREVFDYLRAAGIGVQVNYLPVYWHPAFVNMGYQRGLCPVGERFYSEEISLPMYYDLRDDDVDRVIGAVRDSVSS